LLPLVFFFHYQSTGRKTGKKSLLEAQEVKTDSWFLTYHPGGYSDNTVAAAENLELDAEEDEYDNTEEEGEEEGGRAEEEDSEDSNDEATAAALQRAQSPTLTTCLGQKRRIDKIHQFMGWRRRS